jgi:hypothetical protein
VLLALLCCSRFCGAQFSVSDLSKLRDYESRRASSYFARLMTSAAPFGEQRLDGSIGRRCFGRSR